jgi:hypothetical protein
MLLASSGILPDEPSYSFHARLCTVKLAGNMPATASRMLALPYFFACFAHVSLNVIVRFQICLSRVESGSSAK